MMIAIMTFGIMSLSTTTLSRTLNWIPNDSHHNDDYLNEIRYYGNQNYYTQHDKTLDT
jgi:hypothetical protein